ncbi:Dynein heavy chain 3, axonemal [Chamberlinius hualienensis]
MLQTMHENNRLLEEIQKGLNDYLDKKRLFFPRFFFLSNDELLEILSETKDPTRVQPHLKKCFEGIRKLDFDDNCVIKGMISSLGEIIPFIRKIYPMSCKGLVEKWLADVEDVMIISMKDNIRSAFEDSNSKDLLKNWVLKWPGQSVLCSRSIKWTAEVTKCLNQQKSGSWYNNFLTKNTLELEDIVGMVRGTLDPKVRIAIGALIITEVHCRDVISKMAEENVEDQFDFTWISQLRYYFHEEMEHDDLTRIPCNIKVKMVTTEVDYGFEYLGNTNRLVITPLTVRCYRTLMGALKLNLGGSPEGPAGTGKTETVKDLAKSVAKQCIVFNCSDGLDFQAMGKFLKGLAQAGAWACFDEFNRINLEVLSVISQQIRLIQTAKANSVKHFDFEGTELVLDSSCAIFITMNPGYAGRLELPDNLKVLFRSVTMMVPDYAMIAEISLYSCGFVEARELSRKIIHTYRLCAEQLSQQTHYDYGMRAVKAVLLSAGYLKLKNPDQQESLLVLKALKTVNCPKFTLDDMPLFEEILLDLFPETKCLELDHEDIRNIIVQLMKERKFQPVHEYVEKIVQIYETMLVRHGFMIIGGTLSGKTTAYKLLADAINSIQQKLDPDYKVQYKVINPKSASVGQLYGYFDPVSHDFFDGILGSTFRDFATASGDNRRWIIFDGPVDTGWVENMNTTLDDNKKLCLMNSEIIQMNSNMSLIFESSDLDATSPATVSRCGMIYLEPNCLGWKALKESYVETLPPIVERIQRKMTSDMFDWILPPTLEFLRKEERKMLMANDMHLVTNTIRLYDGLLVDFYLSGKDGHPVIQSQQVNTLFSHVTVF